MYSVHCRTCSEEATAETYAAANDIFAEHAASEHVVELLNESYEARGATPANGPSTAAD